MLTGRIDGDTCLKPPFFINTILLGGVTAEKIAAAAEAGFDQIELWRQKAEANVAGLTAPGSRWSPRTSA